MTTFDSQRHREHEKICRTPAGRRGPSELCLARGGGRSNFGLTRQSVDIQKASGVRRRFSLASPPIRLMEDGEALNCTYTRMTPVTRRFRVSVVNN